MGKIIHAVEMMIQHDGLINRHAFLVADIGEDDLILGYPFFESANPQIDWTNGVLKENVVLSDWDDWMRIPVNKEDDETWAHTQIARTTVDVPGSPHCGNTIPKTPRTLCKSVGGGKCRRWSRRPPIGTQLGTGARLGRIRVGFARISPRATGSVSGAAALCRDDRFAAGRARGLAL